MNDEEKQWRKNLADCLGKGIDINKYLPLLQADTTTGSLFALSCIKDEILYVDETILGLTGYKAAQVKLGGMAFWSGLIHPSDIPEVSRAVLGVHERLIMNGFEEAAAAPLLLTYRLQHANGHWIWIRDSRMLVFSGAKQIDTIIGHWAPANAQHTAAAIKERLDQEQVCTRILEIALVQEQANGRIEVNNEHKVHTVLAGKKPPRLTRREKEILQLVAQGLSTKMIAEKCHISINTVETHRRHLLEKLNVKNSTELINEASKIYWL